MKKYFSNPLFVGLLCLAIGAGSMWFYKEKQEPQVEEPPSLVGILARYALNSALNGDDKKEEDTPGLIDSLKSAMSSAFGANFSEREDDQFVYYEFAFDNDVPSELNVETANGQLQISGKTVTKSKTFGVNYSSSSSISRSFPLPENVDSTRMRMERQDKKIVIKFPKIAPNGND